MAKHTEPDQTLIKMPSLRAVKAFVAAARYQNFTRAAEALCVTQVVGVEVTPALFEKLCQIPNFVSVKDSSGDLAAQASLIRTGLATMNGADPLAPYALYAGAAGLIWGGANMAPRSCVAFVNAALEQQWDRARELWRDIEPAMSLIWQGDYVQSVYAGAELAGYGAGNPRRPLARLAADKLPALKAALAPLLAREAALA